MRCYKKGFVKNRYYTKLSEINEINKRPKLVIDENVLSFTKDLEGGIKAKHIHIQGNFDDTHIDVLKNNVDSVRLLTLMYCELTLEQIRVLSEMKNVECVYMYAVNSQHFSLLNNYSNLKSLHITLLDNYNGMKMSQIKSMSFSEIEKLNFGKSNNVYTLNLHNSPLLEEITTSDNVIVNHPIINHVDYVVE